MEWWYNLVDCLPFDWAKPGEMIFMKNALLAIIIMTPIFGVLGTMIVNNKMAFFSDALGHGAFTGVAIGGLFGLMRPMWSAVIFAMIFSIAITYIKYKSKMASDTTIGVFSSMAIALGIFLATSGGKSFAKLNTYLVGDILSITPLEILLLAIIMIGVILFWSLAFNKMLTVSINKELAASRGINIFLNDLIFSLVISVIVTLSMSWIGLLVINSFLVLPAAASRNIAKNQRQYHAISVMASLIAGIIGLIVSYYSETATGSTIVIILSVFFFITFFLRNR